jgi:IS30 family transposase
MTLTEELEAKIRRLHHAEHWPVGTIAAQLDVHHEAVRHALEHRIA